MMMMDSYGGDGDNGTFGNDGIDKKYSNNMSYH